MDSFIPQSGGLELKEGHEEADISVRGIVIAGVLLVLFCAAALIGARILLSIMTRWADQHEAQLTPVQQQLRSQREVLPERGARTPLPSAETGIKPPPDWYGRGQMEEHLARTFPGPRLQYDDVYDLNVFRNSENGWLDSTGRAADGTIHIRIDRAMDLLAQRGLPSVSGPFLPPNAPANVLAPELTSGGGRAGQEK